MAVQPWVVVSAIDRRCVGRYASKDDAFDAARAMAQQTGEAYEVRYKAGNERVVYIASIRPARPRRPPRPPASAQGPKSDDPQDTPYPGRAGLQPLFERGGES